MSRITNRLGWGIAGALAIALLATLGGIIYAGPLAPPAAPSATGPTQIFSLPYTISSGGTYIVQANLTCTACGGGVDGISITTDNVTVDLNGFAIIGVAGSGNGISTAATHTNIEIRHGTVRDWVMGGVHLADASCSPCTTNSKVEDLRVSGISTNMNGGAISIGQSTTVVRSVLQGNTGCGIAVLGDDNIVAENSVSQTLGGGFLGGPCRDAPGFGIGIYVNGADNQIMNNAVKGNAPSFDAGGIFVGGLLGNPVRNRIDGNSVSDTFCDGITGGNSATVTNNSVTHNLGAGIRVGSNSRVMGNNTSNNGSGGCNGAEHGIDVSGNASTVQNNTVSANAHDGIHVSGSGNNILDNTVSGNNTATGSLAGINILAGANRNRIDSNYIDANGASHGIEVDGTSNTITRNTGGNTTVAVFNIAGAGNTFGPVQVQATPLTNPWANIAF